MTAIEPRKSYRCGRSVVVVLAVRGRRAVVEGWSVKRGLFIRETVDVRKLRPCEPSERAEEASEH